MPNIDFNEDKYLEVLQNIESSIIQIYRTHPELTDHHVDNAVEALYKTYRGEYSGKEPTLPRSDLAAKVYVSVQSICDWRLGRVDLYDEKSRPVKISIDPLTMDEINACLKRIRKSIRLWTKEGGRQGYLNYINQFL